jgi:hypothetical protein
MQRTIKKSQSPLQTWYEQIIEWRRKKIKHQLRTSAIMETNQWLLLEQKLNKDLKLQFRSESATDDVRNGKSEGYCIITTKSHRKRANFWTKNGQGQQIIEKWWINKKQESQQAKGDKI